MPCHNPITAYRSRITNPSGRRSLVFNKNEGYDDLEILVPCGQCIGCKLDRSLEWATRISHEASSYSKSSFVTLTYEDLHLPLIIHSAKRRSGLSETSAVLLRSPLRYYLCGEYGSRLNAPIIISVYSERTFPMIVYLTKRLQMVSNCGTLLHSLIAGALVTVLLVTLFSKLRLIPLVMLRKNKRRKAATTGSVSPNFHVPSSRYR